MPSFHNLCIAPRSATACLPPEKASPLRRITGVSSRFMCSAVRLTVDVGAQPPDIGIAIKKIDGMIVLKKFWPME